VAELPAKRIEELGPGFGHFSIAFATEDRGRVSFMWHATREAMEELLAEFRDRFGAPHQESIVDPELLDAITDFAFSKPGLVWTNRAREDGDG